MSYYHSLVFEIVKLVSLFERFIGLVTLWLRSHTSDIGLAELLYISIEARPGISMEN